MHDNNITDDKEGVGLPAVYYTVILMRPKHDESWIIAHDIIHEQAKDSYCGRASCTVDLLGTAFNSYNDRDEFLTYMTPLDGALQRVLRT